MELEWQVVRCVRLAHSSSLALQKSDEKTTPYKRKADRRGACYEKSIYTNHATDA